MWLRGAKAQTHEPDADNADAGSDCIELCLFSGKYREKEVFCMHNNEAVKHSDIIGGQYQISVLRDDFVPMILDALGKVNTEKVWAKTAKTSTVYRGKAIHVVDCIKACFSHIYDNTHPYITMSVTFFKNSADDISKDCYIAEDDVPLNDTKKTFNVLGRMSVFPLGMENYEKHTAVIANFAGARNISIEEGYYANDYEGNVHDMFDLVNDILAYGNEHIADFALNMSMTIYGPDAV